MFLTFYFTNFWECRILTPAATVFLVYSSCVTILTDRKRLDRSLFVFDRLFLFGPTPTSLFRQLALAEFTPYTKR
jgi:hypothetical protein